LALKKIIIIKKTWRDSRQSVRDWMWNFAW
jgi:hypothetical protein